MKMTTMHCLAALLLLTPAWAHADAPKRKPRIGFTTALSGDGANSGGEMKNAAELGNEMIADNAFEIRFEDERCMGAPAAAAAQKLVTIDKIDYAMGFFCNVALLTALPVYQKAHVPLISSCATTMDKEDVGERAYRLYPADQLSVPILHRYVAAKYKRVGVIAEEDAYAQMLRKEFVRLNSSAAKPLEVIVEDYPFEATDFRSLLLKFKSRQVEALFIDSATEPTFIRIVRQMHELGFHPDIVGVYSPVSDVALRELGPQLEGAVGVTLPDFEERAGGIRAKELLTEYRKRYGPPQSAFPVVLTTLEAMRLATAAERSKRPIEEVVRDPAVLRESLIGPYEFDAHGAVRGIEFVLKKIEHGTSVPLFDPA